ncbi:MAG: hypothetical protein EpisKO_06110 [Epibacterium sp.]
MSRRIPRHPCRPGFSRRDKLSAAILALSLAMVADHYLAPLWRSAPLSDPVLSCAPLSAPEVRSSGGVDL